MSGLISREAVIERIKRMADGYSYLEVPTDYLIQELKKIEEAPSIDAVQVVRCKNCKHRYLDGMTWNCPFGLSGGEDFFCSYGSRMDERKES